MRDALTSLLDAVGLLMVAGGVGAAAAVVLGWGGLAVAGVIVLAGSAWSHRQAARTPLRVPDPPPAPRGDAV